MQGSCLPLTEIVCSSPETLRVFWGSAIDAVGLTAIRTTISFPLLIPPRIPPAWLERNPVPSMGSLCSLPFRSAEAKPSPISTPFTAPIPIIAPAIFASSFPKTGSPRPGGTPVAEIRMIPPTESPDCFAFLISSSIAPGSDTPCTSSTFAEISIPDRARNFAATAPAATRPTVSRPDDLPPPRWSRIPYFSW